LGKIRFFCKKGNKACFWISDKEIIKVYSLLLILIVLQEVNVFEIKTIPFMLKK
jgi:hypothetical protein